MSNVLSVPLFTESVEFLGHVISGQGIAVSPDKIGAIIDWPRPQTIHDVKPFSVCAIYFCRFVKGFSRIAVPLTNLTRKATEFTWSDECWQAFESLKQCLLTAPVLIVYDTDKPCEVWCDASNYAVGTVLMQQDSVDGPWKPVGFLSK